MRMLAASLTNLGIGNVIDETGLTGRYNFTLTFLRETGMLAKGERSESPISAAVGPSIFAALEEQMGVKLISQKVRVEYFVIVSAEKPAEN